MKELGKSMPTNTSTHIQRTANERNVYQQIRAFLREEMRDDATFDKELLTELAYGHFMCDEDFVRISLPALLRGAIATILEQLVCQTHRPIGQQLLASQDNRPGRRLVMRRLTGLSKWERWLESTGEVTLPLMEMTREQVGQAIAKRERPSETSLGIARLLRAMYDQMQPGQKIRERFRPEEIDLIERRVLTAPPQTLSLPAGQ